MFPLIRFSPKEKGYYNEYPEGYSQAEFPLIPNPVKMYPLPVELGNREQRFHPISPYKSKVLSKSGFGIIRFSPKEKGYPVKSLP